jgi:hypothetical protein
MAGEIGIPENPETVRNKENGRQELPLLTTGQVPPCPQWPAVYRTPVSFATEVTNSHLYSRHLRDRDAAVPHPQKGAAVLLQN